MISVIFTCKRRPALTELCLKRFTELMPEPYELFICHDGAHLGYTKRLEKISKNPTIIDNPFKHNRFTLINDALYQAKGEYFMHLENDFYWEDPACLDAALNAMHQYPEIDYIRFEYFPFTAKNFYKSKQVDMKDIVWFRKTSPYRFTFNPHIRRMRFPCGEPFQTEGFTKQPEQHHNDCYEGVSCAMTGYNFRHLGIYDEGGHYKPWYAERLTLKRGDRKIDNPMTAFLEFCDNMEYYKLWLEFLDNHGYKHSS